MRKLKAVAELFEGRHFDREVIILCVRVRFAPDSPLEGDGFELSVPGPANRPFGRGEDVFQSGVRPIGLAGPGFRASCP